MSNVELFLFILKLFPTLKKKIVCQKNYIPSPARAQLLESDVLVITHSISFLCWFGYREQKTDEHGESKSVWRVSFEMFVYIGYL